MRAFLAATLCAFITWPAVADQIDRCGIYDMEGVVRVEPAAHNRSDQLSLVLEPGSRSETIVLLGDYDPEAHKDLIGTHAKGSIKILNFCQTLCLGDLQGDLTPLAPDHELAQFFFPWPEPTEELECAADAPIPDADVLLEEPADDE